MRARVVTTLLEMETTTRLDLFWNGRTLDLAHPLFQRSTFVTTETPSRSIIWLNTAANKVTQRLLSISRPTCAHGTTKMRRVWKTLFKSFKQVVRGRKQSEFTRARFLLSKTSLVNLILTIGIGKRTSTQYSRFIQLKRDLKDHLFSGKSVSDKPKLRRATISTDSFQTFIYLEKIELLN